MRIRIDRLYKKDTYTIGRLYVDGVYVCDTLEDKVRDLSREPKVYGETAIPPGEYLLDVTQSPKFGGYVWGIRYGGLVPEIVDVPLFSGVRIHPGNGQKDTAGCPLVGENKVRGGLINAVKAYYKLMDNYVMPAYKRGETIIIEIR